LRHLQLLVRIANHTMPQLCYLSDHYLAALWCCSSLVPVGAWCAVSLRLRRLPL
jgi:hypothetical protein